MHFAVAHGDLPYLCFGIDEALDSENVEASDLIGINTLDRSRVFMLLVRDFLIVDVE